MGVSDDLPPQITKGSKRRSKSKRTVDREELAELLRAITRAAHIARDKGCYTVSPEAVGCVQLLRHIRSLPLTPRLITETDAFRTIHFLSTNGNPKIRSESRSLLHHLKTLLAKH